MQHTRASTLHTRATVRHTRDISKNGNHDRLGHEDDHEDMRITGCNHVDDHLEIQYDRKTLLRLIDRMEAAKYQPSRENALHLLDPPPPIRTIRGRELDYPCYGGRYGTPANHNNHSRKLCGLGPCFFGDKHAVSIEATEAIKSDDQQSTDNSQQRPQQEKKQL